MTYPIGTRLNYNDGRIGHVDVKATVLTVADTHMIVKFDDRAETTLISFNDKSWMKYIREE